MSETNRIPIRLCAGRYIGEDCVAMDSRSDITTCDLTGLSPDTGGKILDLTIKLRNIRPGKRVALGVILSETGPGNLRETRGVFTATLPAHNEGDKRDLLVKGVRFVLPEDVRLSGADERHFSVQTIAHYIDAEAAQICALPADGPCPISASDA